MDNTQELSESRPFTAVEFCAGYSGICIGLKRAIPNLRVIAVSEIEAFAAANLVAKMEEGLLDSAPVWPDLKTFPNKEFHNKVDLLIAGFPCQPFSAAGKRGGDEDPRHLFPYIKQSLIDMQPKRVFLENVEGIISSKLKSDGRSDPEGTPVLLHVLRELERVGYVATAGVFSAAEVGAPHQRKRVFIYGQRVDDTQVRESIVNPEDQWPGPINGDKLGCPSTLCGIWPSRPGEQQYDWEPPRVVGNAGHLRSSEPQTNSRSDTPSNGPEERAHQSCNTQGASEPCDLSGLQRDSDHRGDSGEGDTERSEVKPQMGRDSDGLTDRLDYAELYTTCDNRVDELRLLGNGVVPACAEKAWGVLSKRLELAHSENL